MEAGPGEEGPEGLTQCSNHPARSPAVGGVPAQALWGSQRIPSPCHKLPWAGTPAHSNRSATTGGLHRSLHSHTLPPSPHSHPLFLTHSHSPSYTHVLSPTHAYTLTRSHPHSYTLIHTLTHTHALTLSGSLKGNNTCSVCLHPTPTPQSSRPYLFVSDHLRHASDQRGNRL